jgi:class 3 adenylate cyclase
VFSLVASVGLRHDSWVIIAGDDTQGLEVAEEQSRLTVVMFEDIERSTAVKRVVTKRTDEQTFQDLRRRHDVTVKAIVEREGAGEVVKWTGDGMIALFGAPSAAVERAVEIQEAMHQQSQLKVRIGIDMGEVRVESRADGSVDVFGAHVDRAARAMSLADGGHVCVTGPVHDDAFAWITKSLIAWKKHGLYRVKAGEEPFHVYQPYNANHHRPMRRLRGEKVVEDSRPPRQPGRSPKEQPTAESTVATDEVQLIRPWEGVARDGRDFAQTGVGTMYWFKVPLGGLSYPDGYRYFLEPALENPRIGKIRFVLDRTNPAVAEIWNDIVLPMTAEWAERKGIEHRTEGGEDRGRFLMGADGRKQLAWVFVDLSTEFTPCFKLFVDDPDMDEVAEHGAQIFLSTANRTVRLADGTERSIRIPDAVLRVRSGRHEALLHALNAVANQWDSLFL